MSPNLGLVPFLLLHHIQSCQKRAADEDVVQLKPSDCVNNTEWLEQNRTCGCLWGWTGTKCDVWEQDECYYAEMGNDVYEGKLSRTSDGSECEGWTADDVKDRLVNSHDIPFASDKWSNGHLGDHNYCRNPDSDPAGFWCYTRDSTEGLKAEYCAILSCKLEGRSFFVINSTSSSRESSAAIDIIFGPVLPGVCGGVVALMTIVGFGEFLRRRRIFQKLRRRLDPESGAPRRLGGVVTVDVDTGLQPEAGNMQLVDDPESKDGSEGQDQETVNFGKSSLSLRPDLGVLPEEEEEQENNSEGKDNEDSRPEATEPLNSSRKREFEAGLSDLRHKLAQEVIIEEDDEEANEEIPHQEDGDQNFGMMKFRRSGKSTDAKLSELDQGNSIIDGPPEMSQQLARSESKSNQEKFAPMNIGGNRTSSRNSFVLNTISRFETQSIASIKGEDMDSLIDSFHHTKVSDHESAEMRARDRPRRKDRPSADPTRNQDIHNYHNQNRGNLHFYPPPPPQQHNINYHAKNADGSPLSSSIAQGEKEPLIPKSREFECSPDRERFYGRFPQESIKKKKKTSNYKFDIVSEYRDKIKPSQQKTIQLPKINPCDSKLDDDVYNRRRMPIIQRPALKPIPRSILEKYANTQLPAMSHPTSERLYQESIGKYHMYDEFPVEKRRPRRKVPSINFSDIEEQIRSVDVEESPKQKNRKDESRVYVLKVNTLNKKGIVGNRESDAKIGTVTPKLTLTRRNDAEKNVENDVKKKNEGAKEEKMNERGSIADETAGSLAKEEGTVKTEPVRSEQMEATALTGDAAKSASDSFRHILPNLINILSVLKINCTPLDPTHRYLPHFFNHCSLYL
ncbi:Oidioi.mRNA.OKI2018_I69.XSR.g14495.t1.cds [Oikopleura dioica]|uniref:Oidioi.mRNA.OKI2018_I69.XSR.g14495.t1.cds n=1 Tax=Oikopleura dioica TaxID=34765 RepID=A0ABN7SE07_OIKDI|nr:Oidioi.mRNA.OKI2018_I69.XSR.g14495.t1.cds [Oikopleura dioica]